MSQIIASLSCLTVQREGLSSTFSNKLIGRGVGIKKQRRREGKMGKGEWKERGRGGGEETCVQERETGVKAKNEDKGLTNKTAKRT